MIRAVCSTCHVQDMRDMCHAEICATADVDHFRYFVYEEVNTRLTQNISMCSASSVSQMGQSLE